MITHFPTMPPSYSAAFFNTFFQRLQQRFSAVVSKDEETPRLIMRSYPSGKLYQINVSDIGRVYTSEVDDPGVPVYLYDAFMARMTNGQAIGTTPAIPAYDAPLFVAPLRATGYPFDPASGVYSPPTGLYQISASLGTTISANNAEIYVAIFKNGVEVLRGGQSASSAGIFVSTSVGAAVKLDAGDTLDVRIWADRTGMTVGNIASGFSSFGIITS